MVGRAPLFQYFDHRIRFENENFNPCHHIYTPLEKGIRDHAGSWSDDGMLSLTCTELNIILKALVANGQDYPRGKRVVVGIRPEDIRAMREWDPVTKEANHLHGRITTVVEKGASHNLLFVPEGSRRILEVEVGNDVFHELDPRNGIRLSISLNKDRIFLVEQPPTLH